jgi:hypothetical protein
MCCKCGPRSDPGQMITISRFGQLVSVWTACKWAGGQFVPSPLHPRPDMHSQPPGDRSISDGQRGVCSSIALPSQIMACPKPSKHAPRRAVTITYVLLGPPRAREHGSHARPRRGNHHLPLTSPLAEPLTQCTTHTVRETAGRQAGRTNMLPDPFCTRLSTCIKEGCTGPGEAASDGVWASSPSHLHWFSYR